MSKSRPLCRRLNSKGFTVVELLIATLVFSVILLIVTSGILQITRTYYKGVTESNTQTVARNVINTISQAIQFDGGIIQPTTGTAPGTSYAFCIGSVRFRYVLGSELSPSATGTQTHNALLEDDSPGCAAGPTADIKNLSLSAGTKELLSTNMRLSVLSVTSLGNNLYNVSARVVYGDDDLLTNPAAANAACQGFQAGTQFCSVSQLSTTVLKRVQ